MPHEPSSATGARGSAVRACANSGLPSLATRPGDVWTVEVRVSDGTDLSSWLTSDAITVGSSNQAPAVSNVVIGDGTVAANLEDKARLAVANCPEFAIGIED